MSNLQSPVQMPNLNDLPPEIILEIITQVPYHPESLLALQLTQKDWHTLICSHEQSLVSTIRKQQYSEMTLRLFPSLPITWQGMLTLHNRLQALTDVHENWLRITHNGPELHWLRDRWVSVHRAGMLLLYRLYDNQTYAEKVETIQSLPKASLACLMFKLFSSIKILRLHGPEPINLSYAAGDLLARSDVELAFEEVLLTYGPDFFVVLLNHGRPDIKPCAWAVDTLKKEISGMDQRQLAVAGGVTQSLTLTSVLRRAFAAKMQCHVSEVASKMWEVLGSTSFDCVDDELIVEIVSGHALVESMRRTRFCEPGCVR